MIQAHTPDLQQAGTGCWTAPTIILKPGQRLFWVVLAGELVVLLGVFALAVFAFAPQAPVALADSATRREVVDAVYARVSDSLPDRMISVEPGVLVRESNVRGFRVDGRTYYYQLLSQRSFDPLSLGQLKADQVEVVYNSAASALPLTVYTIR